MGIQILSHEGALNRAHYPVALTLRFLHNMLSTSILIGWPQKHSHTHNRFTALFPGPPGWAGARRELVDFMVQGKINRGRHTDLRLGATPSGLTSAHLHHPPYFLWAGCPSCHPTNSVKALKAIAVKCCIKFSRWKIPLPCGLSSKFFDYLLFCLLQCSFTMI